MSDDILSMIHRMMEEGLQKEMNLPGWKYRDIPWMTEELWNLFIDTLGLGNYVLVASTSGKHPEHGNICRGQFMIGPQGMANLEAFYEQETKAKETEES